MFRDVYELFDAGAVDSTPIVCDYDAIRLQRHSECHAETNSHRPAYCSSHANTLDLGPCTQITLLLRFIIIIIFIPQVVQIPGVKNYKLKANITGG